MVGIDTFAIVGDDALDAAVVYQDAGDACFRPHIEVLAGELAHILKHGSAPVRPHVTNTPGYQGEFRFDGPLLYVLNGAGIAPVNMGRGAELHIDIIDIVDQGRQLIAPDVLFEPAANIRGQR